MSETSNTANSPISYALTRNLRAKFPVYVTVNTTWESLVSKIMNEPLATVIDKLDAPAMTAGPLATVQCTNKTVAGFDLLISDHDDGLTMQESADLARKLGHEVVIYPSINFGIEHVEIPHEDLVKYAKGKGHIGDVTEDLARAFLRETGKLRPSHADVAVLEPGLHQTAKGFVYRLKTPPIEKHRVIRPLKNVLRVANYVSGETTQDHIISAWKVAYPQALGGFGTTFDPACKDPSRRYFMPATYHNATRPLPAPIHVQGDAYDILPIFEAALAEAAAPTRSTARNERAQKDRGTGQKSTTFIFDGFNLKAWAVQYAKTYDVEGLMERAGLVKADRPTGGKFVECHQTAHSGGVQETFVQNGDGEKGFVIHCSGATGRCCDMDRLEHLIEYLRAGTIKISDLEDVTLGGGPISNRAHRDQERAKAKTASRTAVKDTAGIGVDTAVFTAAFIDQIDFGVLNSRAKPGTNVGPGVTAEDLAEHIRRGNFGFEDLVYASFPQAREGGIKKELCDLAFDRGFGRIGKIEVSARFEELKTAHKVKLGDIKEDFHTLEQHLKKHRARAGELSTEAAAKLEATIDYSSRYAVISTGRTFVLDMQEPNIGRALMAHDDFKKINRHDYTCIVGDDGKPKTIYHADQWLNLPPPEAQFYPGGLVFKPSSSAGQNVKPDQYNLFSGFLVEPDPSGSCQLFYDLIHDVWVQGDKDLYDWVIEYFMHPLRYPGDKIGTAIAIRGSHGDGKSIVTEQLMTPIYGDMLLRVTNHNLILGDYNEAIAGKLMIALEEAAFAGSKPDFAKMKELITGHDVVVNPKHKAPMKIDNYARMIVISNQKHFLDIEKGDRRYTVLNSAPAWKGTDKFEALIAQWAKGGAARFMYESLNHEFRKVGEGESLVINTKIKTENESVQGAESRDTLEKFFVQFLLRGNFSAADPTSHLVGLNGDFAETKEIWALDQPLILRSAQIEDAVADFYMKRAPTKQAHAPALRTIISTMREYFGETEPDRPSVGGGKKGPTAHTLPARLDALMFAYKAGRITQDEFRSVVSRATKVSKTGAYVVLGGTEAAE